MSFLRAVRQTPRIARSFQSSRAYAVKSDAPQAVPKVASVTPGSKSTAAPGTEAEPRSICTPNTVLDGLNYLKGQAPVLALPDEEYPPWLWDILQPKVLPDDGPGGKAEKVRLRKENRQRIRDQNFMKTQ